MTTVAIDTRIDAILAMLRKLKATVVTPLQRLLPLNEGLSEWATFESRSYYCPMWLPYPLTPCHEVGTRNRLPLVTRRVLCLHRQLEAKNGRVLHHVHDVGPRDAVVDDHLKEDFGLT